MKNFFIVFVSVLFIASLCQAECLKTCNSQTLDSLEKTIRNEKFYGEAWSQVIARGTCHIDICETTTIYSEVEWIMYTNTDGYVQMYFNAAFPSAFEVEIELTKDSLDRSWKVEVFRDQAYTWMGLTNNWIYERKDSQMNEVLSKLYTGLLVDNLSFISAPEITWLGND